MGSPTPSSSTTTTQNQGQQDLYKLGLPFLKQAAANPPQLPTGPLQAGFDPAQTQGQEDVLAAASGPQTELARAGAGTAQFLSGDVLSPDSNPALKGYMDAAVKPLYQNLTESVLPSIRNASAAVTPFGGTRQGIAEGLAAGRTAQAAGTTEEGIANTGYGQGLDALVKNLGLLPGTIQSQLAPGISTSGVGDIRQALAQAGISEANLREQYPELLPLLMGQTLTGIGSGIQPTGTTTTGVASAANPLTQGLGLGIAGLGALGTAGGTAGVAGLAPLLPFLSRSA